MSAIYFDWVTARKSCRPTRTSAGACMPLGGLCEQSEGQSAHLACHWGDCVNRVKGSLPTLHATGGSV